MNAKNREIARLRTALAREQAAHEETRKMLADLIAKQPAPLFPIVPWQPPYTPPVYVPPVIAAPSDPPCAFDNLPPGVYGLVCFCPKCSPRYGITYTSNLSGLPSSTYIAANAQPPDEPVCIPSLWLTH